MTEQPTISEELRADLCKAWVVGFLDAMNGAPPSSREIAPLSEVPPPYSQDIAPLLPRNRPPLPRNTPP